MKKIITIIFLTFSILSFGQSKIEGIGKFKIKQLTVSSLNSLIKDEGLTKKTVSSSKEYFGLLRQKEVIAEVFPDTIKSYNSPPSSSYCHDTRVFLIPEIEISKIKLNEIILTFYNDTLVKINTKYGAEIVDALTIKYGEPYVTKRENIDECTDPLEGKVSKPSKIFYQEWKNEDITCTAALGYYFNDKCENTIISYLNISLQNIDLKIRGCDTQELQNIKKRQKEGRKDELEGF